MVQCPLQGLQKLNIRETTVHLVPSMLLGKYIHMNSKMSYRAQPGISDAAAAEVYGELLRTNLWGGGGAMLAF